MDHHGRATTSEGTAPGRTPATAAPARDFAHEPLIWRTFPALRALACVVELPTPEHGLSDDDADNADAQGLLLLRAAATEHLGVMLGQDDRPAESSLDSIRAWRAAFSATGVRPTQHRCAAESLLRRLRTHGDLPQLHPLVDLGNALSVRWAVPVAVIDLDRVQGALRVTRAGGQEQHETFAGEMEHPDPGEVIYLDDDGHAHSRRWCWRQSARSIISPATRRALVVVEALHVGAEDDLDELAAALGRGAGPHRRHRGAGSAARGRSGLTPVCTCRGWWAGMTLAFLVTSLVIVATPGTGAVCTVSAGLLRGRRAAVLAAAACTLGSVPHLLAALTGLAALLHTSAVAYAVLTWAGIAYLLYLAVMTRSDRGEDLLSSIRASARGTARGGAGSGVAAPVALPRVPVTRVVHEGVVLNLLNLKLTLFFFAFLPQFIAPGAGATAAMAALGGVFMALTLVVFTGYGLAATALRPLLRRRPTLVGVAHRVFAVSYVVIAVVLAIGQLTA